MHKTFATLPTSSNINLKEVVIASQITVEQHVQEILNELKIHEIAVIDKFERPNQIEKMNVIVTLKVNQSF